MKYSSIQASLFFTVNICKQPGINRIALNHLVEFLEYIPHLQKYFIHPARVEYGVPMQPGSSADLLELVD
jgi:hypothetical protein